MKLKISFTLLFCICILQAQNTAVTSGSIGKCAVWGHPVTLFNNSTFTHYLNSGITVTVDEDRHSSAVVLGTGSTLDLSGSNGISFTGSGTDLRCKWQVNGTGSYSITNNQGNPDGFSLPLNTGVFFTAPYAGSYRYQLGTGWSAAMSGAYLNGGLFIRRSTATAYIDYTRFYTQNEAGSCGLATTPVQPGAFNSSSIVIGMGAGQRLSYAAGTVWNTSPCNTSTLNFTVGNAVILFDN